MTSLLPKVHAHLTNGLLRRVAIVVARTFILAKRTEPNIRCFEFTDKHPREVRRWRFSSRTRKYDDFRRRVTLYSPWASALFILSFANSLLVPSGDLLLDLHDVVSCSCEVRASPFVLALSEGKVLVVHCERIQRGRAALDEDFRRDRNALLRR